MSHQPVLSAEEVTAFVREVFPQAEGYQWELVSVGPGTAEVRMAISSQHLRPGGTISGPTMFALADIAAYLITLAHVGKVALAVTTNLNINFLNKPSEADLTAKASILKLGKRLSVCDVAIFSTDTDNMVAHATATYSIPPRRD